MLRVYYAGPIGGLEASEVRARYKHLDDLVSEGSPQIWLPPLWETVEVIYPVASAELAEQGRLSGKGREDIPSITGKAITTRDKWWLISSDVLLADLRHNKDTASIGTIFELSWAKDHDLHVVAIMDKDNPGVYDHPFVQHHIDVILPTPEEAVEYLRMLVKGKL